MHSINTLFAFIHTKLLSYYQNNKIAYFVSNQLIKLIFKKDYILIEKNHKISDETIILFKKYIHDITIMHMPYQYIIQEVFFCNTRINVKPPVLIPRIETEELVHWIIEKLNQCKNDFLTIVDFCSGSGCIGIALLHYFHNSKCTAFDICHDAITMSAFNARINGVKNRYTIYQKDILNLKKNKKYDIIISNPPYIPFINYNNLDPSVKNWESPLALTDQKNGYTLILYLLKTSRTKLNADGLIIIEIDHSYAHFILAEASKIYKKELVFLWSDQYGKQRAIIIVKGRFSNFFIDFHIFVLLLFFHIQ